MKAIYEFRFDCGRMGALEGLFAVNDDGEKALRGLMASGEEVYFGEVLGKHSEIRGPIEEGDLTLKTDDSHKVEVVMEVFGVQFNDDGWATISGWNPFHGED
jgi:hypothetical protein